MRGSACALQSMLVTLILSCCGCLCSVSLPRGAIIWSAVGEYGISWPFSRIFDSYYRYRMVHGIGPINAVARTRLRIQMHVSSTKIFFKISNEYGGILCMSYICELWGVIFVNN